jgi:hypothetical protein
LDRRLGVPQSCSGHSGGEEKNSQPSPGVEKFKRALKLDVLFGITDATFEGMT